MGHTVTIVSNGISSPCLTQKQPIVHILRSDEFHFGDSFVLDLTDVKIDLQCYSQSHRLLSLRPLPKMPPVGTTPRDRSPIHSFRDGTVERWDSTSEIMERLGTVTNESNFVVFGFHCVSLS